MGREERVMREDEREGKGDEDKYKYIYKKYHKKKRELTKDGGKRRQGSMQVAEVTLWEKDDERRE